MLIKNWIIMILKARSTTMPFLSLFHWVFSCHFLFFLNSRDKVWSIKREHTMSKTNASARVSNPTLSKYVKCKKKEYKCKYCEKCFRQPSHCKRHELTHTGEKPYQCTHCNKCFGQSSHCKRHELTHTGGKPYQCKHCDKFFSQSSNCKCLKCTHTGVDQSINQ